MKAKIAVLFVLLVYFTSSIIYPFAESSSTFVIFNGTEENVSISGYTTEITPGQYSFKNKITYQILSPQKTEFNRYTIRYSSSACVKGTIYYKIGTVTHDENFYLEPGYNVNFSSLIDSYLNGQAGANAFKIDFVGIEASLTTFTLYEISTEIYENQLSETIYLENGRFKLGVCLMWGGGLNYFEDKKDNDSTITNMLNYHDTGRLIQQSYYGTMSAPYICSTYGDTTWAYNPVQGGDQHGNKSKLVDFTIEEDSIYVKCLPLDWAKNGTYTMSYMENRYTLNEDYVSVDNRFIDFSGYDHGYEKDQELPAFYTISYLDTFTFYNGNKPWTDGKLITKEALPFWGGNGDCYFTMSSKNTETWCAWTNEENGYGIGLYTPGITTLLAGRFEYDDSKDPMSNSTNYVAPLIRTTMRNFEAFEYSYIITSGTVSEMRSTFKEHKDDEATSWDSTSSYDTDYTRLDFDGSWDVLSFSKLHHTYIEYVSEGIVKFTVSNKNAPDVQAYIDYTKNKKTLYTCDNRYLVYTYMLPTTNSSSTLLTELFICTGDITEAQAEYSIFVKLTADGNYHTQIIDLFDYPNLLPASKTKINKIRFDYLSDCAYGDELYLSEFSLTNSLTTAEEYGQSAKVDADVSIPPSSENDETAADDKSDTENTTDKEDDIKENIGDDTSHSEKFDSTDKSENDRDTEYDDDDYNDEYDISTIVIIIVSVSAGLIIGMAIATIAVIIIRRKKKKKSQDK